VNTAADILLLGIDQAHRFCAPLQVVESLRAELERLSLSKQKQPTKNHEQYKNHRHQRPGRGA
jgi:hypothetical protein